MSKVKGKGRGWGRVDFTQLPSTGVAFLFFAILPTHTLTRAVPCFMHCHGDALKQTRVLILTRSLLPANPQFVFNPRNGDE